MGFEVTKKNVKDVSSLLSQSELKKKTKTVQKEKPKSEKPPCKFLGFAQDKGQTFNQTLKSPF